MGATKNVSEESFFAKVLSHLPNSAVVHRSLARQLSIPRPHSYNQTQFSSHFLWNFKKMMRFDLGPPSPQKSALKVVSAKVQESANFYNAFQLRQWSADCRMLPVKLKRWVLNYLKKLPQGVLPLLRPQTKAWKRMKKAWKRVNSPWPLNSWNTSTRKHKTSKKVDTGWVTAYFGGCWIGRLSNL